jgi:hypothetical protein
MSFYVLLVIFDEVLERFQRRGSPAAMVPFLFAVDIGAVVVVAFWYRWIHVA